MANAFREALSVDYHFPAEWTLGKIQFGIVVSYFRLNLREKFEAAYQES